jgi:hypothetical protein
VDNFVDNVGLTPGNAIFHAGFNKMPSEEAKKSALKIKHLGMPKFVNEKLCIKILVALRQL